MPFELDDRFPVGRGPRQADRRLHHLGPGRAEPHPLGAGNVLADEGRRLELDLRLAGKEDSLVELAPYRVEDHCRVVPEDHRPHAEVVVDELGAISVEQIGTLAALDDEGGGRDAEAEIAADTAGEVARRTRYRLPPLREPVHAHRPKHPTACSRGGKTPSTPPTIDPPLFHVNDVLFRAKHQGVAGGPELCRKARRTGDPSPNARALHPRRCRSRRSARGLACQDLVFRYLQTLRACGLIAHDADRDLYRVDAGILALVPQGGGLQRLREIALPHMRLLQRRYNETVNLGIIEGVNVVYIEIIESKRALRMQARVGGRDPVYSTAIGKAILAIFPMTSASRSCRPDCASAPPSH